MVELRDLLVLPYQTVFVLALLYELGKRETIDMALQLHYLILAVTEAYDANRKAVNVPCTGDLLCERTGVRHRSGCYATYGTGYVLGIQ